MEVFSELKTYEKLTGYPQHFLNKIPGHFRDRMLKFQEEHRNFFTEYFKKMNIIKRSTKEA